jgi:hypothetical protein
MKTRSTRAIVAAVAAIVAAAALVTVAMAGSSAPSTKPPQSTGSMHSMHSMHATASPKSALTATDLRVTLDRLFGQHAVLAMNATNAGVTGSKSFPAVAKALDGNSVALSKAIASIYGAKAGETFLNGKYMWRDHIKFFVNYTVALAKKNRAGQNKAVADLKRYTVTFGNFLAGATGLPKLAVRNDLLGHVLELKSQLDAYASGDYARASIDYDAAYDHMFMTGDLIAGAIAKQKNLK